MNLAAPDHHATRLWLRQYFWPKNSTQRRPVGVSCCGSRGDGWNIGGYKFGVDRALSPRATEAVPGLAGGLS